jgi:hypothetical protein
MTKDDHAHVITLKCATTGVARSQGTSEVACQLPEGYPPVHTPYGYADSGSQAAFFFLLIQHLLLTAIDRIVDAAKEPYANSWNPPPQN